MKSFYHCPIQFNRITRKQLMWFFLFYLSAVSSLTNANPAQPSIQSGQVQINSTGQHMQINQSTSRAIINWRTFNIGQQESVHFQQPQGGATINRINPTFGASMIYGKLTSTGQLILINGSGIYFGPTAFVNVGGLIATTADISNADFLKGNYQFRNGDAQRGAIINDGKIAANHGLVALVGASVINNGVIEAELGHVILASANAYTINFSGDGLINFAVQEGVTRPQKNDAVTNAGIIRAHGGKILITAKTASAILDQTINMKGIVDARSFVKKNGEIILLADEQAGKILVKGKLLATGVHKAEQGGKIKIAARKANVETNSEINVSGNTGAGEISILAHDLAIAPQSHLLANALVKGDGGKIILYGKNTNQFFGKVQARGAGLADGGFVEVSGKNKLIFNGSVDTNSTLGKLGTLLIDPKFLIIANSGTNYDNTNNLFSSNTSGTTTLTPASLNAVNSNIILQANSDVIFNDPLNLTGNGLTLTVEAGRSILINQSISTQNGAMAFTANSTNASAADRSITNVGNPTGDTETTTGNIIMASGTSLNAGTADISFTVNGSTTSPFSPGVVQLASVTGRNVTVNTPNSIFINAPINSTTTTLVGTAGSVVLNSAIHATNAGNNIVIASNTFINNAGANALDTGAGFFQVWSGSPTNDTVGGLPYNFKQYNAQYGVTTPLGTGNGLFYLLAPIISNQLIGSVSKVYDSTTTASLSNANYLTTGVISGDVVQLFLPSTGSYDTKNVGINKIVTATGIAILSATSNGANVFGYQLNSTVVSANIGTITAKNITAQLTGNVSKTYDTNNNAALTSSNYSLPGVIGSDAVVLNNPINGSYSDPNAGVAKTVSVTGLALLGADALNYNLTATTISGAIGTILPATLNATLTGNTTKIYDTTTTAAVTAGNFILSGILGTDQVSLIQPPTGQYNNANVGTNKLVTVTGLSLSGTSANNYQLAATQISANIGSITPATLTAALTGTVSKVYDTATTATVVAGNFILSGVLGADQVNLVHPSTGQYDDPNVGTDKLVTVTGLSLSGSSASNYQLAVNQVSDNIGIITPATLTASLTGTTSKIYDTNTLASLTAGNFILSGVLGTDQVNLNPTSGQYNNANVGTNKLVTATGLSLSGSEASNYQLAATQISANIGIITPATLTAALTGTISKVYNTNTVAPLTTGNFSLSGILGADQVTLTHPSTGQYNNANVGTNKLVTVTGLSLSGSSASNYQLTTNQVSDNVGIITPATLTVSLIGNTSKVYNATTVATLAAGNFTMSGVLGADQVTLTHPSTGQYNNANVGTNKLVTVTGLSLSGSSANNYQIAMNQASGNIGTITPATLTTSLTGNVSKVYDTTTTAPLTASNFNLSGVFGTDQVSVNSNNGQYNNANVGTSKLVTATGLSLSGSAAGNYQLITSQTSGNIGTITPATLTASLTGNVSKVYDATTAATLTASNYILSGVLGADQVSLNHSTSGQYNNANVGTNKLVTVTGISLSGSAASNYQIAMNQASGNIGTITPATLTATLTGNVSKVYDTTTTAPVTASNFNLSGVLGADQVNVNSTTGQYDNADVGVSKLITVNSLSLTGSDANNYQLATHQLSDTIGTITPAMLTASLTGSVGKVYDTTTAAAITTSNFNLAGVLGTDKVRLNPTTGLYDNANVGTNKFITASSLSLSGSAARNYRLSSNQTTGAIGHITPATVFVHGIFIQNKNFDGTLIANADFRNAFLSGVLGRDRVFLNSSGAFARFSRAAIGDNIIVTVRNLILSGAQATNYRLSPPGNFSANILGLIPDPGTVIPPVNEPPGENNHPPTVKPPPTPNIINPRGTVNPTPTPAGGPIDIINNVPGVLLHRIEVPTRTVSSEIIQYVPYIYTKFFETKKSFSPATIEFAWAKADYLNLLLLAMLTGMLFVIFFGRRRKEEELTTLSFKLRTALESIIGFSQIVKDTPELGVLNKTENSWIDNIMLGAQEIIDELARVEAKNILSPDNAMAFHLRTALNDIKGFAELIYDEVGPKAIEKQKEFINNILLGSNSVLQLLPVANTRPVKQGVPFNGFEEN